MGILLNIHRASVRKSMCLIAIVRSFNRSIRSVPVNQICFSTDVFVR